MTGRLSNLARCEFVLKKRVLIIVGCLFIGLAVYVGSFVLIRWLKPACLKANSHLIRPYCLGYWPLRWLTADRSSWVGWNSTGATDAVITAQAKPERGSVSFRVGEQICEITYTGPFDDIKDLTEGSPVRISWSFYDVLSFDDFSDLIGVQIDRVERSTRPAF
jgi:hypothetical protein